MAQTAFQIAYRQEYIHGFEQRQSLLRQCTTTFAMIQGQQATFLVASSGGAAAVTRGVNGLISPRTDSLSQPVATLVEWHDMPQRNRFNVFASQGDGRLIMQQTSQAVINRRIDQDILDALSGATLTTGAPTTATVDLILKAMTILQNNSVWADGDMTLVASPAMLAYLMKAPEFTNSLYQDKQPIVDNNFAWQDKPMYMKWLKMNIIVTPQITGLATANEQCYMFHRNSMGHAADVANMQVYTGYHEEQDYYWARASIYAAAKLLQSTGVVVIPHDGSAFTGA